MKQTTLDECEGTHKCPYCGKIYKTRKGLKAHITRNHLGRETWVAPDEKVEIRKHGRYVDIRLKIRKPLWEEISRTAHALKMKESDIILALLCSASQLVLEEETTYIG